MVPSSNSRTALIWGFNNEGAKNAILELKRRETIQIAAWFGTAPECRYNVLDMYHGRYCKGKYQGYGKIEYQAIFDTTIFQFMDQMTRHVFYAEKQFHDLLNIYNELYDLFSSILVEHKVDVVLFSNLPHEGPELILYRLAKAMKISTILFHQSNFPGKFFYTFDLEDFGTFAETPQIETTDERFTLVRNHRKDLFYMDPQYINHIPFSLQSGSMASLLQEFTSSDLLKKVMNFRKRNVNGNGNQETKNKFGVKSSALTRGFSHLERQISRFKHHSLAKKDYLSAVYKHADLNCNFVYFPLHLQPELTTVTLGGIYADQILAIERLSKILPEDWLIYVKENPKQTELMRGRWFFSRLAALENVRLLDPGIDTYLLMEHCRFVATITGTAGWEAISGGKNALVFGQPWYKGLPGVFSFDDTNSVNDILSYKIDHDELEEATNNLLKKTGNGVIDKSYTSLVNNFDSERNSIQIADFIENLIERGFS